MRYDRGSDLSQRGILEGAVTVVRHDRGSDLSQRGVFRAEKFLLSDLKKQRLCEVSCT